MLFQLAKKWILPCLRIPQISPPHTHPQDVSFADFWNFLATHRQEMGEVQIYGNTLYVQPLILVPLPVALYHFRAGAAWICFTQSGSLSLKCKIPTKFFKWTASKRSHPSAGLIVLKRAICGAAAKKRAHVGGWEAGKGFYKKDKQKQRGWVQPCGRITIHTKTGRLEQTH